MVRGQEAAAPQPREQRLGVAFGAALRDQHDERGQVAVLAAQAVADPRAHARAAGLLAAGLEEGDARVVVDRLRVHRPHDAQLVDDPGGVRQQLAHPRPTLAVLRELEHRGRHRKGVLAGRHAGETLTTSNGVGQLRPAKTGELRLVIEKIHLRRRARLKQVDDPPGAGHEVRQRRQPADHGPTIRAERQQRGVQQRSKRGATDAAACPGEELASVDVEQVLLERIHRSALRDRLVEVQKRRGHHGT